MATFVDVQALAKRAGVTRQTLYRWLADGEIVAPHTVVGRPLFLEEQVGQIAALARERKATWRPARRRVPQLCTGCGVNYGWRRTDRCRQCGPAKR